MNVKTWIPLILAVALGGVALVVARKALRPGSAGADTGKTTGVVVAKHDVGIGQELSAGDLVLDRVPADKVPAKSFANVQDLVGRATTTPLLKGQPVVDTLLAPAGSGAGVTALVPPGMRAITIEINEFSGLGGMLVPGSRVDVLCTVRDDKSAQQVSRTILQNIRVLATGKNIQTAPPPDGQPAPGPTNNVTLLVTPKQAQGLQLASQGGRPWLVLRSLRDGDEAKVDGTSMAEIRGDLDPSAVGAGDPFARPGPTTNPTAPATQPAEPAAPARQVWTMRVIRGGVPTEISFPIDPAREARDAAEREAVAQAAAQAAAAQAAAAQAAADAAAQAAAQDALAKAALAEAPAATPVPATQPAVADATPAAAPTAPVAPELPATRPAEPEVKTADLPTENAVPAVLPDAATADRNPAPPAAEPAKESDKPAETTQADAPKPADKPADPATPVEPGADKPVTGTDTELKQELTK